MALAELDEEITMLREKRKHPVRAALFR